MFILVSPTNYSSTDIFLRNRCGTCPAGAVRSDTPRIPTLPAALQRQTLFPVSLTASRKMSGPYSRTRAFSFLVFTLKGPYDTLPAFPILISSQSGVFMGVMPSSLLAHFPFFSGCPVGSPLGGPPEPHTFVVQHLPSQVLRGKSPSLTSHGPASPKGSATHPASKLREGRP